MLWSVQRTKSRGTEPLSTGLKQLTEDDDAGVRCQRALSLWLDNDDDDDNNERNVTY